MSARRRPTTTVPAELFAADGTRTTRSEEVVVEAPLEIRVAGETLTLTMRTPGDDRALALGFLLAEGVITSLEDVGSIHPCDPPDDPARAGNTIELVPAPGARLDLDRLDHAHRAGLTTSACGICGRDAIDDLLARARPVSSSSPPLPRELLAKATEILRAHQRHYADTGGLHAAAALDATGAVVASAEDIGRHNAVDKVVGQLLLGGRLPRAAAPQSPILLVVSSRASFEVVQKAAVAGFPAVVTISAASSLAIETAQTLGLCLAAFAREGRFTVYCHGDRVAP